MALAHLHRHGLIHRDIKPSNIIFVGGVPKLADIGLVTDLGDARSFVGTEGFIPPEGPNSAQADIYSLGKVLYEISMGKDRKDFPEPASILGESAGSEPLEELNAVVLKACAPKAADRYQSAEELHADLALLNSGKSVRGKRLIERRLDFAKRMMRAAAVLAVIATVAYLFQRHKTREVQGHLYVANMNLAQRDWEKANVARLAQALRDTETYPGKGFEWYFWERQLHLDQLTIKGAARPLVFSADGTRILTGSADCTARIWDAATGRALLALRGHKSPLTSAAFSADGRRIVTGSEDSSVRIWDASDGRELEVLQHTGMVMGVAVSPDGRRLATASRRVNSSLRMQVTLWNMESGEELTELDGVDRGLGAVAFSPDGQRIAAMTDDVTVKCWDAATGDVLSTLRSRAPIYCMGFSPDGQRIATGLGARAIEVWDAASGRQLLRWEEAHRSIIWALAFSPDGKTLVTGGGDQQVVIWDSATGKEQFRITGHRGPVMSVAFTPDGQHIASAGGDGDVKIWDAAGPANPQTFPKRTKEISAMVISADQTRIPTCTWGRTLHIWDVATRRESLQMTNLEFEVTHIAFSPDGKRIAIGNGWHATRGAPAAKILDCITGHEVLELQGNGFVTFSPDGRRIATSHVPGRVTIWDALAGHEQLSLAGHAADTDFAGWVQSAAFSPDGKKIATAGSDRKVKVWDANTGREMLSMTFQTTEASYPFYVTFSPDGKRIGFAANDRTPRIWDASTGRELLALQGHIGGVAWLSFSLDGSRIATFSSDRSAKIWDAFTGRELLTLEGHERMVKAGAFFSDGRRLATAGHDGLIKIWQTASPEQIRAWREKENASN